MILTAATPGPAPGPYTTIDVGVSSVSFHTYVCDCNGRKIAGVWGPVDEKVWTAALFAAAPDLLTELQKAVLYIEHMAAWIGKQNAGYSFESLGEDMPGIRAAITKATGAAA
jgi:hypothetical protein